tara:strand:- start:5945 stop:7297 length:1353 start_codon:yes stop_codon:yes gene_type:complete
MKNPLVTVYITNYNYGNYIEKSIKSLLNQSFKNFEILIIDDGSTDNSRQIIEKYSTIDKIKIIYQKNKGLIVSNNIALRLAKGKYLMRLDADDYLDNNALKIMVDEMEKDNLLGLVYPNYFIVDENENVINYRIRIPTDENNVKDNPAHGACTLIRKKFLKSIGGYDERYNCQDGYFLWINFFSKFKVKNIETPLFYYRRHGNNLTNNSEKILTTRSKIISKYFDDNEIKAGEILAIIPIRGKKYEIDSFVLEKINANQTVLDIKIEEILKSKYISKIVVSTPDNSVIEHLKKKNYKNLDIHIRDPKLARMNSGLVETVNDLLLKYNLKNFDAFLTFSVHYPFLKNLYIDNAIKSMYLFETDSVISVRKVDDTIFRATEDGIKPFVDVENFSKLEREDLYKYSGGMIATKISHFLKESNFFGGKNGHVIIDEASSKELNSINDIKKINAI